MKFIALMTLFIASSFNAHAISINFSTPTCSSAYNIPIPSQNNQTACELLNAEVQALVQEDLPSVGLADYTDGTAASQITASSGFGSDYSDNFNWFVVKGGLGLAVSGDLSDAENADGFATNVSGTIGVNLDLLPIDKIGPVDLSNMDVFINAFSYSLDQDSDDTTISGDLSSFGVFARYQLFDPITFFPYLLEWGGVHLHTGLQMNTMKIGVTNSFADQRVALDSGQSATFSNGSVSFDFESTSTVIPVEVSTFMQLGYVFTVFGGLGSDIVVASESNIDLVASGNITGGINPNDYQQSMSASEKADGEADTFNLRGFAGIQLNIPFVRLYAQINKGLTNDTIGTNIGVKVLY